ncbi:LOW QUALITY PROTEIN: signal-induced proliferation-associated 1-like protein 3 [Amazona ochrocephala]
MDDGYWMEDVWIMEGWMMDDGFIMDEWVMTDGCDTVDMTLRRKGLGQLGFHVKYDGTVAEVEDYGFAWQVNLRQGSCLVEICKVAVVTLNHDQMIDLLRISITLKVVIVPPHEDRAPWRFVAASEPHDGDSSSGGISSHESTMERHNPEPLWHVPVQPRLPTGRRSSKEEPAGMDSPKQHSKGEALNSSYSSTTTLSSTTSSDERWFNIPDTNDGAEFPDPFPKGSCNDSSIGTPKPHCALSQRDKGPKLIVAPGDDATTTTTKRDQSPPSTSYRCKEGTPPQPSSNSQMGYPGYSTPTTEAPHRVWGGKLSASIPKSFFSKQQVRNKQARGWKRAEEKPEPQKQVEATHKNVFGQPRLHMSLRDLHSTHRSYKSTIRGDLKKLIIIDTTRPETPPPKGLKRTLSDESLCGGCWDPAYTRGIPVLQPEGVFGSSYPSGTLPNRCQHPATTNGGLHSKKVTISASELSLCCMDPGMMPDTVEYGRGAAIGHPPTAFDLPEEVTQLKAMLKQLHSDLQKEKQDKAVLHTEVADVRHNN